MGIALTDWIIDVMPEASYRRALLMRASVASVFCSPHKYKVTLLDAQKLTTLFDKYAEYEEKASINEPVKYFKKILLEYLDEQVPV